MTETIDQPKTGRQRGNARPPLQNRGGFNVKESADYLGISKVSVRRLIDRGLIKPNRALRHILIPKSELDRFLAS